MDFQGQRVLSSNSSSSINNYISYHYVKNCTQTQWIKKITCITSQLHVGQESCPGLTGCQQVSGSMFQVRSSPGEHASKFIHVVAFT